jgi:ribosomal RNA-processing protein 12
MYNSDSEIDSEADDKYIPARFQDETKSHSKTAATIIENQDDVLDFLDSSKITSQISSVSAKKSRKRSREDDFETDEYGRLVLCEPEVGEEIAQPEQEDYYKQTLTGEGSFVRTPGGRIKFLDKGNKKAKTEEFGKSGSDWRKKNHNKKVVAAAPKKLGAKYASKKAGGDVKRKGMADPHAYIPLSGKIVGNIKKKSVFKNEFKKLLKTSHRK